MIDPNLFFNNCHNFSIFSLFLFFILIVWSLIWKGLALWKSARRGEKDWFIAFLIINTVGILEILYLYILKSKENNLKENSNKIN